MMKNFLNGRLPAYDSAAIRSTIQRALASAGLDTTAGPLRDLTQTLRRVLKTGGVSDTAHGVAGEPDVIDIAARTVPTAADQPAAADANPSPGNAQPYGRFETHRFSNRAGTRTYKLYVPARAADLPRAMVVMLHGCTQDADDFAAGTRMNRLADTHGFLVVYPEQAAQANTSKCWNWFNPQDQQRDAGEPSLIAGMVREVAQRHGADLGRIFVAGLSAGAAMAVALGETYPELFAGVGAHSGLPYGSAHDIPSALAAMKGGRSGLAGLKGMPAAAGPSQPKKALQAVPVIVFHGDRDHTVQQTNGAQIVQQAHEAHQAQLARTARAGGNSSGLHADTQHGVAAGGRRFSRTVHADATGQVHIESWTVHGAGHAWSGGDPNGSYTESAGPDASKEMVRFFLALPPAGVA